jgi:hypothetical protein
MTDDKGAGEGPYKAGQRLSPRDVFPLSSREASLVNYGYAAGRKAERERCLSIVQAVMCVEDDLLNDIGKGIVETIKIGGQDGE